MAWRRFRRACREPAAFQRRKLHEVLSRVAPSAYGRRHGLDRVRSASDLQGAAPVVDYDDLVPWIERVADGDDGVLTVDPVEMMEATSGSTAARKLIPYTAALRGEFSEAVAAWMVDLHRALPLLGTRSYWSVSRAVRGRERTAGGLAIGFEDDSEYFGPVTRWALGRLMAVPSTVARATSHEAWRHDTCVHLLKAEDLGLFSVWSPSFLVALMAWLDAHLDELAPLSGRAAQVLAARVDGRLDGTRLWPRLALVSSWADGSARRLVPELTRWFPGVAHQPKGLLATEGVVSVPMWGHPGGVAAVTSHFLEFLGEDRAYLVHELDVGGRYQPVLTTSGGLVRYALRDVVEVVGRYEQTPLLQLVGRSDGGSDLAGEKLSEAFVAGALERGWDQAPAFAMLAPSTDHYVLFVAPGTPGGRVEDELRANPHYADARDLNQLGPLEVVHVQVGRWEAVCEARGQRLGDLKPTALETRGEVVAAMRTRK